MVIDSISNSGIVDSSSPSKIVKEKINKTFRSQILQNDDNQLQLDKTDRIPQAPEVAEPPPNIINK